MFYPGPGDEVTAHTGERLIVSVEKLGRKWQAYANFPGTDVARYMALGRTQVLALIALDRILTRGYCQH